MERWLVWITYSIILIIAIRLCGKTQANVNFANSAPMNDTCGIGQIPCGSGDLLFCVS